MGFWLLSRNTYKITYCTKDDQIRNEFGIAKENVAGITRDAANMETELA